jgi:molybdenum cofactor guanylyltransferase
LKAAGAGPDAEAAGFVLAGGQSTRMGTEKSLIEFEGRPLIAHAVGILAAAGLPPFIAGARAEVRSRLEPYAPVIPDAEPGLGPLGGICAALAATTAAFGMFLPVDVPLLPASLVVYLLRRAQMTDAAVTLASVNGFPQTFPAVLSRRTLATLGGELRGGRRGCLASFQAAAMELGEPIAVVPAEVLVQSGQVCHPEAIPVVRWFVNLNTEQDLRLASSRRAARVS